MSSLFLQFADTRDLAALDADGMSTEARIPYAGAIFTSEPMTAAELETLIAAALDAEVAS